MPLVLLNYIFHALHLGVIVFNLFGWLHASTKRANLICLSLTGISWFVLGLHFGIGYCPITDWHWQVREALGERDLPNSYVADLLRSLFGLAVSPMLIDAIVASSYFTALVCSLWVNFSPKR